MFTVLPFGLSSAPHIFTKLFIPLVKHWRSKGIHSVVYLDDGLDVERSEVFSSTNSNKSDLASAGFLANMDKCLWDPVQVITWLGIVWDGVQGVVSITEPRLKKCLVHIDKALSNPNVSARDLASLVGKIISMSAVLARELEQHHDQALPNVCRSSPRLGYFFTIGQVLYCRA